MVTNLDFDAWNSYLGDGVMTMALLDRLVDSALTIEGVPYSALRQRPACCPDV